MGEPAQTNRRKYARVRTDAVVLVCRDGGGAQIADGVDLGLGGIRFRCVGLGLALGEIVEVTVSFGGARVAVVGQAVRVAAVDSFVQEVSLAFGSVDPKTPRVSGFRVRSNGSARTRDQRGGRSMAVIGTPMRSSSAAPSRSAGPCENAMQ